MSNNTPPIIEARGITKRFAGVVALDDVDLQARAGEVLCLLGDNGAGKSTLIKILSGVYGPTKGELLIDGVPATFSRPSDAQAQGIATVHQNSGTIPLLSVARNFFLGAEPTKGRGPFRRINSAEASRISLEVIHQLGITHVSDASQLVGTLSGGERQALAVGRAVHFGARLLILDEPTAALGVREAAIVLRLVAEVRERGVSVILITHNSTHALTIGDQFAVLIHGGLAASFARGEKTREEVIDLMAGGQELQALAVDLNDDAGRAPE